MLATLNIVNLIEKSAMTRLSNNYENKLLMKIKENFSENQQQIFVASFYTFLNYDSKKDFVVDFDNVWKWLGFSRKDNAKRLLEKHFLQDIGYKIISLRTEENTIEAGRPTEKIMLNIITFKKFCLKSGTRKADEIHDYYVKLEELFHETVDEETNELRNQITIKDEEIKNKYEEIKCVENHLGILHEKHIKLTDNHNRLINRREKHKLKKGKCLYIIRDLDKPVVNEISDYIFGITKHLSDREQTYYSYLDPVFEYVMFTNDNKFLENCIKKKYKSLLRNNERIKQININDMISFIEDIATRMNIDFTSHRNIEELYVNDDDITTNTDEIEEEEDDEYLDESENESEVECDLENSRKCTKCKKDRDISCFTKDRTKKSGYHGSCKVCQKENKIEYLKRKRMEFVALKEKKCSICETIKDISLFSKHLYNKDGYVNNCYECIRSITNNSRNVDKDAGIRYKCNKCNKDYTRKDSLLKHVRADVCSKKE